MGVHVTPRCVTLGVTIDTFKTASRRMYVPSVACTGVPEDVDHTRYVVVPSIIGVLVGGVLLENRSFNKPTVL